MILEFGQHISELPTFNNRYVWLEHQIIFCRATIYIDNIFFLFKSTSLFYCGH